MQQHLHTASDSGHIHGVTDPGHTHNSKAGTSGAVGPLDGASSGSGNTYPPTSATTGISIGASVANISVANAGTGTSQNMPPALMLNAQIYAGV